MEGEGEGGRSAQPLQCSHMNTRVTAVTQPHARVLQRQYIRDAKESLYCGSYDIVVKYRNCHIYLRDGQRAS